MNDLLTYLAYRWYGKGLGDLTADELEVLAAELTAELADDDPMAAMIQLQLRAARAGKRAAGERPGA